MNKTLPILLVLLCLFSCKKNNQQIIHPVKPPIVVDQITIPDTIPFSAAPTINISFDQSNPGNAISQTFEGLSYEVETLTQNPEFLNEQNSAVVQLFKNLGPGILRIGGNSSDKIPWTGSSRTVNNGINSLNTNDIDRLSKFASAAGWPVIFGLNLGANDPASAADEAKYIAGSFRDNLRAVQMGNEPDYYVYEGLRKTYGYGDYIKEWKSYFSAIKAVAPRLPFGGPDVDYNTGWIEALANNEKGYLRLIDQHFYAFGHSKENVTYNDLLQKNAVFDKYLQVIHGISTRVNLPYRITECNSVSRGKTGVSDVFASALWGLDFMWLVAQNNGEGINFHGGIHVIYSPIDIINGIYTVKPLYYGMLAFKYATTDAKIIPVTIDNTNYNCSAYACAQTDGTYMVTLINKEAQDFAISIHLNTPSASIQIARLIAPDLSSPQGVTFANSQISTDGTFTPKLSEPFTIIKNNFTVKLPAGSAAVVKISRY